MPAMTSPLRAFRFSGRLMVIQNACPRFSSSTLLLPVIACLPCLPSADINGRMTENCKDDLSARSNGWSGFLHPDLVVMEGRATVRSDRLGAGQHVDAAAAD